MSSERIDQATAESQRGADNIAVGVVGTPDNTEQALRAVHRASARGHDVFVAHTSQQDLALVRFVRRLDVDIIEPADSVEVDSLSRELVATAMAEGYEGIIVPSLDCERIQYEHTLPPADDAFRIDPVTGQDGATAGATVVGIPAYNEADTIATVVEEASQYADTVLVVDDGSDDETASQARSAGADVVEHGRNKGYGQALKTLFAETNDRQVGSLVVIDADGQHDPADIPRLARAVNDGADVVIGSRFAGDGTTNAPLYRRAGLTVVNALTNLSMGVVRPRSRVCDTQSGFRAYDAGVLETLAADDGIGDRMSASTDILYHARRHGYELREVGTTIEYDMEKTSTQHPLSHGFTLVQNILTTIEQQRPMTVLGVPGFVSTVVGVGFAYWTLANYISSGAFPIGLAIVSVFFTLVGVFACFTGIILHSLNQHFD